MGVNNFTKSDLVGDRLKDLLNELRTLGNNGQFLVIRDFLLRFGTEMRKETFFAEQTGRRSVDVDVTDTDPSTGTTTHYDVADLNAGVKKIVEQLMIIFNTPGLDATARGQLDQARQAFADFVDPVFQQGRMMEELAGRGYSSEEFLAAQEEANKESEKKRKEYEKRLEDHNKLKGEVLGDEYKTSENPPRYAVKNLATQINHRKATDSKLQLIESELTRIRTCYQNIAANNADTLISDAEKANRNQAEQNLINQLATNIHGAIGDVERMDMGDIVPDLQRLKGALRQDATSGNYSIDSAEIDNHLNTVHPALIATNNSALEAAYTELNTRAQGKRGDLVAEGIMTDAEMDALRDVDPTTHETTPAARAAMDDFVVRLNERSKNLKQQETYHSSIQQLRTAGAQRYRELRDRVQDFRANTAVETRQRQRRNPDGTPMVDANGNPVTETYQVNVPNDALRSQYLADAGFDRDATRAHLAETKLNEVRNRVGGYGYRQKRQELKARGIGNWFTRLFPNALTNSLRLNAAEEAQVDDDLRAAENGVIEPRFRPYYDEARNAARDLGNVRSKTERARTSAPVQEQVQYGAFDVARKHRGDISEKQGLMDEMSSFSYEDAGLRQAIEWGLGTDKQRDSVRRNYDTREETRDHATRDGVNQDQSYAAETPRHEDRDGEPDL